MELLSFALISIGFTYTMFITRETVLGFFCFISWALFGGYCFTQSTATIDFYRIASFASIGVAIGTLLYGFALREKRDSIGDTSMAEDGGYIDEEKPQRGEESSELFSESRRTRELRARAAKRRERLT